MIQFNTVIKKFTSHAEKTGWTYVEIPSSIAGKIKPGYKKTFRVKGIIHNHPIDKTSILPAGNGDFILPLNKSIRQSIKKPIGATIILKIEEDRREIEIDKDLMDCLQEEPKALACFNAFAPSHQRYFSKWITDAKTAETKARRIGLTMDAMLNNLDFGEMIRLARDKSRVNRS